MWNRLIGALIVTAMTLTGAALASTPGHAAGTDAADPLQSRVLITDRDRTTAATVEVPSFDPFVRMLRPTGDPSQIWQLRDAAPQRGTRIVNEATGNCLQPDPTPSRSFVIHGRCGQGADVWLIRPSHQPHLVTIINVSSRTCLTHPSPATTDRRLRVTGCVADDVARDQLFRLLAIA